MINAWSPCSTPSVADVISIVGKSFFARKSFKVYYLSPQIEDTLIAAQIEDTLIGAQREDTLIGAQREDFPQRSSKRGLLSEELKERTLSYELKERTLICAQREDSSQRRPTKYFLCQLSVTSSSQRL